MTFFLSCERMKRIYSKQYIYINSFSNVKAFVVFFSLFFLLPLTIAQQPGLQDLLGALSGSGNQIPPVVQPEPVPIEPSDAPAGEPTEAPYEIPDETPYEIPDETPYEIPDEAQPGGAPVSENGEGNLLDVWDRAFVEMQTASLLGWPGLLIDAIWNTIRMIPEMFLRAVMFVPPAALFVIRIVRTIPSLLRMFYNLMGWIVRTVPSLIQNLPEMVSMIRDLAPLLQSFQELSSLFGDSPARG